MQSIKQKFFVLVLFTVILFSCKKDDDAGCSVAYGSELQNEITALSTAAQLYGTTPNQANCLSYKNAVLVYINKLEPYGNCNALTIQQRSDFDAALSAAKSSANALNCQ